MENLIIITDRRCGICGGGGFLKVKSYGVYYSNYKICKCSFPKVEKTIEKLRKEIK